LGFDNKDIVFTWAPRFLAELARNYNSRGLRPERAENLTF